MHALAGRLRGGRKFLPAMLLLLLLFFSLPAAIRPQPIDIGRQNQGRGLAGEIFGEGAAGDGGRNGMDHAWDGKTDTWFDCLGPPDNFWDGCYTGIKLATPIAIGQIRFYPRARCPGCGYAGPDRPQNPGCAGSEHKDKGACRMVGGKFEGALEPAPGAKPDATGLVWNTLATIRDRPSEEAWTSIASTDSTPYSYIRYHSGPGGFCNVAELEFYAESRWGWVLACGIIVAGTIYAVGGVAYGERITGGGGSGTSKLAAHPHYTRWIEIAGLCSDGVAFARGGGRRPGYHAVPSIDGKHDSIAPRQRSPRKAGQKKEKKTQKEKSEKTSKSKFDVGETVPTASSVRASSPAPATRTPGTKAGDGGRWVHVPS